MKAKMAYKIQKNKNGERSVLLVNGQRIPADVAGLCVGPDKWLSKIECKCRDCGMLFPLSELHGGGQWCARCQVAGMEDES